MKLGIIRLYCGKSGEKGFYNIQEIGLAKSLIKRGIEVDIFFLSNDIKEKYIIEELTDHIRLITIKIKRIFNHGIFQLKILDEFKIDVIHLLSDNQIFAPNVIEYCKRRKIPYYCYVGTIESDSNNFIKKIIMDFISKRNIKSYKDSRIICKTKDVEKRLNNKDITNTKIVPVGLDLNIIPKIDSSIEEIKSELGFPNNKILLFVGRLEEYKRPLKFIELMRYIIDKDQDYLGIIIGNGSLKESLYKKINEYGLDNNIILIDKVSNEEIHKYYKVCDAFINLNKNEIFGMSILEAMYQGCLVIAHSAPGPNYIIDSGKDGIILDSDNFDQWISEIEESINKTFIRSNAREKIVKEFNWDSISDKFVKLISEIGGL